MYKKFISSLLAAALLCGIVVFPASASTPKEITMHHKLISEEQLKSLEQQGYQKHEIWKAAHLAKITKQDINTVLAYYKQTKSWEDTAKHFGVDPKKLHKHHMSKEMKEALLQKVAEMQKSTPEQVKKTMKDYNIHLRHLVILTIIAQKSNTPLNDVLQMKKDGMHIKQIADKLNVKKEDIRAEMHKLIQSVKAKKTE
ncbi:hypothetical protein QUF88_06730 [Bacillus sp. DX1.1]|uniref:hypothetical protein n=1 Tax=unclassified Bacillus (in: firmicutes) TaxID=185979 RepID=UPI00256FD8F0|nr:MULTISPECIES: hypothetical protein [unclassified Bacillus (in: firmicutes)]MDM5153539.1 hypothetical protein [Bacillus sp. DX1.1]WJE82491.1 hypothetical protein QRE67_04250 [Bacillus sp. DX3.1]